VKVKTTVVCITLALGLIGEGKSCGQSSRNAFQETKNATGTPLAPGDIFAPLRPSLTQKTAVPPRLPSFIPFAQKKSRIYPILKSADQSGYDIELGWTGDCNGGNACHYGTVRGSSSELVENDGPRVPVKLDRNIEGYFIESTCDVHCDDAAVGWTEGNYHYSISLKAGKKDTLIKMANSAIQSTPK
jgi:hypothetical protein